MPRIDNPSRPVVPSFRQRYSFPKAKKPPTSGSRARKAKIRLMAKDYTADDWKRCLQAWGNRCAYCNGGGRMQQEHFFPVDLGGTYTVDNIIPACGKCNSRKQRKHPLEWLMEQKGGLSTYVKILDYLRSLGNWDLGLTSTQEISYANSL